MTRPALHLLPLYFSALKIFAALLTIFIFYFLPSLWYRFTKKEVTSSYTWLTFYLDGAWWAGGGAGN